MQTVASNAVADDSEVRAPTSALRWAALACGIAGAVVVALGPVVGAAWVAGRGGAEVGPVPAAAVVAAVAVMAAPVVAVLAAGRREWSVCLGLLIGNGVVSLGLAVFDGQLFADAIDANRFELARPLTAAPLDPGLGAYCVLIGHAAGVIAAILAAAVLMRGESGIDDDSGRSLARRMGAAWTVVTGFAAASLSVALFPAAWRVTDPVIVAEPVLDSSWFDLAGTVVTALCVLANAASAFASETRVGAGALLGAGLAASAMVGPRLAAGLADSGIDATPATFVGGVAVLLLIVAGIAGLAPVRLPALRLPGLPRAVRVAPRVVAGVFGVASAIVIGIGALAPTITVPDGFTDPAIYATRTALVAAAVLLIVSVWLLLSEFADQVRPAVGVICVAVLTACSGVLNAAVEAQRIEGVGLGVGAILIGLGALGVVVAGGAVAVAGADARDALDRSVDDDPDRRLLGLGGAAAIVGVIAMGLPLYRGSNGTATSFGSHWGLDTWGQVVFAAALIVVAIVGSRARPARAVALYCGAVAGLAIYLAGWPLTSGRVADATVAAGVPTAGVSIVLFAAAAALAARESRAPARKGGGAARVRKG